MSNDTSKRSEVGGFLIGLGEEIKTTPLVKKIDWTRIIDMVIQMLPIILAFFQEEKPEEKTS